MSGPLFMEQSGFGARRLIHIESGAQADSSAAAGKHRGLTLRWSAQNFASPHRVSFVRAREAAMRRRPRASCAIPVGHGAKDLGGFRTRLNKGLELIEPACLLPYRRIRSRWWCIRRASFNSLVEYLEGSMMAQLSNTTCVRPLRTLAAGGTAALRCRNRLEW